MTKQFAQSLDAMESAATAALTYMKLEWEPLRLPPLQKSPAGKWKEPRVWSEAEIRAEFSENSNVGIALGKRSRNLIDCDYDCREAAELAKITFDDFPSFGRPGSPYSHRIVQAELKKGRYTFELPKEVAAKLAAERAMLLEVRGDGHQTMFPPSIHPSGERVQWHIGATSVPTVEADELLKLCGIIAVLSTVAMAYPKVNGQRDEVCMMIAGVLVRAGLEDAMIDDLIVCVASLAGDEEAEKRRGKAAATRARVDAGEGVWGLPELCSRLEIEEAEPAFRKWLGSKATTRKGGSSGRPVIVLQGGNLPSEVDQAEAALLAAGLGVYQRGENLVRVLRLPQSEGDDGVQRPSGALLIHPVSSAWLKDKFAISAIWMRNGKEEPYPVNPPHEHARALLARVGEWHAPVLRGVVSCPTMRADGTILQEPGYDSASGLLYDPGGVVFPQVPNNPSFADAQEAMRVLRKPFREYQLPTPADWSVLLAAVVTSVIRRILPTAPLFAIDAPTAGSGKTLLCEAVGVIASGYKPTIINQGKTPEEDEKRLASILMAGDAVLVIDNCERQLGGDTLCSMLTSEVIASRILGKSEMKQVLTNVLVMATGNNLEVVGDLGRRTLVCRIDTGAERPDQIEHSFDLIAEVLADRPRLVVAALTVLRAYVVAGKPNRMTPLGSFEGWNLVREALVWLGEEDPAVTRENVIADDPRKNELAELLELWADALGGRSVTLAELANDATKTPRSKTAALHQALAERTPKPVFNTRSVGRYLAKHKDRLVSGRKLLCIDDPSGVKRYRLETPGLPPAIDTPF
ncbi:bifunctional DNA primase/polymerase [Flavimaricola marinus]|uniref:DNA primase/polymerase bifunctional N-terminal domain-containing protein n=1 Tax=Flavimaricola marinus TaxID=1819565 RepID=A0A238LE85_9RHOB|nr:bifunctional DNA primase/polymerase [Flavimaricola marinus]SMY07240.1 hypothetical protein LOM8899_01373 [Flavimaricola marinus]